MSLEKIKNKETAKYQLTKKFTSIFLGILLLMNVVYLIASATFVYNFLENKATGLFEVIELQINNTPNQWEKNMNSIISSKEEDGLLVTTKENDKYYTEGAFELFNDLYKGKSLPFIPKIIFSDEGIYYVENRNYDKFTLQLAINSESAIELVYGMLLINAILNLLAVALGSVLMYLSVRSWSKELTQMAQEIRELNHSQLLRIKVPEKPIEIKEVAVTFNELLKNKELSIEREKQFIANASHDLKTPIAAIRGHIALIKRRGEKHPEIIPKSIDFIDKESIRLEKLSRQLLMLNQEEMEVETELLSLTDIVLEEVERSSLLYLREFELSVAKNVEIIGSRLDFQQLIQNLIENAVKYSPDETAIQISLNQQLDSISLEVNDYGIGVLDTEKEKIFERFYRVDASRTSTIEGTGIGLSIVKKVVNKYKGTIEILDNQPRGSKFIITFPR